MAWGLFFEYGDRHVVPLDDERHHILAATCWCEPFLEDGIIVHVSLDGREKHEADHISRPRPKSDATTN
jgi:hypothetical protein